VARRVGEGAGPRWWRAVRISCAEYRHANAHRTPTQALPRQGGGVFGSRRGAEALRPAAEARGSLGAIVRVAVISVVIRAGYVPRAGEPVANI
jgi:hypothetical protein